MSAMVSGASRWWLLLWVVIAGCGRSETQPVPNPGGTTEPVTKVLAEQAPTIKANETKVDTGEIAGVVQFSGQTIPMSTIVPVGADLRYCGSEHSKEDCVIDPPSRGIRYVIVRLEGEKIKNWPHPQPGYLFLDNKNCRFEPHAAVLTVGSTIEMHNSDKIAHTVHAYFGDSFNYLLPPEERDTRIKRVLQSPGLIMLRCDVHGWMNSFIQVDPHPFHAVTDVQGRFAIRDVPVGTYNLVAWHERFGAQKTQVAVPSGQGVKIHLQYEE